VTKCVRRWWRCAGATRCTAEKLQRTKGTLRAIVRRAAPFLFFQQLVDVVSSIAVPDPIARGLSRLRAGEQSFDKSPFGKRKSARLAFGWLKHSFVSYEVDWHSTLLYQSSALPQLGVHPDARRRLFDSRFPLGSQYFLAGVGAPSSFATES